jgi:hypothetical protein
MTLRKKGYRAVTQKDGHQNGAEGSMQFADGEQGSGAKSYQVRTAFSLVSPRQSIKFKIRVFMMGKRTTLILFLTLIHTIEK